MKKFSLCLLLVLIMLEFHSCKKASQDATPASKPTPKPVPTDLWQPLENAASIVGALGQINSIAIGADGMVYAAGKFNKRIIKLSPGSNNWQDVASNTQAAIDGEVKSIKIALNGTLYACGLFM